MEKDGSGTLRARNRNLMMMLAGLVAGMVGLAYASVPLYDLFCRATGFDGTPQRAAAGSSGLAASVGTRDLEVTFNADVAAGMPWRFYPLKRAMTVRDGVTYTAVFVAENPTDRTITGSATFNVSPDIFGQYFVKVQCFCFERQVLKPGERVEMPVVFYLDPRLEQDPYLGKIGDLTLAYTFFEVANEPATTAGIAPGDVAPAGAGQAGGS